MARLVLRGRMRLSTAVLLAVFLVALMTYLFAPIPESVLRERAATTGTTQQGAVPPAPVVPTGTPAPVETTPTSAPPEPESTTPEPSPTATTEAPSPTDTGGTAPPEDSTATEGATATTPVPTGTP